MTQALHSLEVCALDLLGSGLAHSRRGAPIKLTSEQIDGTFLDVNGGHSVTRVETAKIKVEIAVEDAVGLGAVQVPNEPFIDERGSWCHHTIDPVRIEERLVDERRFVIKLSLHGKEVAALQRNGTAGADFFGTDGYRNAHLAGHGSAADDGLLEPELLDDFADGTHVGVFGGGMVSRDVVFAREAPSVGGQVKGNHGAFGSHSGIIHHGVILAAVASSSVEEDNLLRAVATSLVEDLASSPDRSINIDVFANNVKVVFGLSLLVLGQGTVETLMDQFQKSCCEMGVLGIFL